MDYSFFKKNIGYEELITEAPFSQIELQISMKNKTARVILVSEKLANPHLLIRFDGLEHFWCLVQHISEALIQNKLAKYDYTRMSCLDLDRLAEA